MAKRIWSGSKLTCKNHQAGFLAGCNGPLPVFHFQTGLQSSTDVLDHTVQPGSHLVLADCIRSRPNGSGPKSNRCARIIRPASGQCFPTDPDRIRIGSGMFTGSSVRRIDDGQAGLSPSVKEDRRVLNSSFYVYVLQAIGGVN